GGFYATGTVTATSSTFAANLVVGGNGADGGQAGDAGSGTPGATGWFWWWKDINNRPSVGGDGGAGGSGGDGGNGGAASGGGTATGAAGYSVHTPGPSALTLTSNVATGGLTGEPGQFGKGGSAGTGGLGGQGAQPGWPSIGATGSAGTQGVDGLAGTQSLDGAGIVPGIYQPGADLVDPAAPSAPRRVKASVAGVRTIEVAWAPPATDGGSAITGYRITPHDATTGLTARSVTADGDSTSFPLTDLSAGDKYTFTVTAVNYAGRTGPPELSNPVVPVNEPLESTASGTSLSATGTATATVGTPGTTDYITATAKGAGTVTVGTYHSAPLSGFTTGIAYYDVAIAPGSAFTSLTFTVCGQPDGATIQWWEPTKHLAVEASKQTRSADCITVTVNATTSPSLADMYGTIFGTVQTRTHIAAGNSATLATTGASDRVIAEWALLLLALGAVTLSGGRRRRRT
ncbi:MAG: fibronectin type III domain-containing protein, partial [Mycobacteriaceae bacterium]